MMLIFAPVRYYASGLPAFALLLSAGMFALLPKRLPPARLHPIAAAAAAIWLMVSVLVLAQQVSARPPNPVITAEAMQALRVTPYDDPPADDRPRLVGYALSPNNAAGMVNLTLYLTADERLGDNFVVQIDMQDRAAVSRCQFAPAQGTYPTTRWNPGEIVVAHATLPNCAAPLDSPIDLKLQWLRASLDGTLMGSDPPPMELASVPAGLSYAASCPANLGMIGGYQVVKFNSPPTLARGDSYLPSINWIVRDNGAGAALRTFYFTHADSGQVYPCVGSPYFHPDRWRVGEQVFFDSCQMQFPPDAPPGRYTVGVALEDADAKRLSAVAPSGAALPNNIVPIGEITLNG
jgi:hypothetical protein